MNNISNVLHNEVETGKTPSVQYMFFNADNILFEYSEGYADLTSKLKVDRHTTFNFFSITKTFTAIAIMQLVEKKLIALEKPVKDYLPSSKISEKILVKHLLNHTSGLPNPIPLSWIHLSADHNNFNRDNFFKSILENNSVSNTEPGSKFNYSNLGYICLAQIIEAVSGIKYEDYVKKNILDRLPLESDVLDFELPHNILHAKGYHNKWSFSMILLNFMLDISKYMEKSVGKWKPFKHYYVNGAPYGGLIGNSRGIIKYAQELLKERNALISEKSKKLLFLENIDTRGRNTGMCLSWFTGKLNKFRYMTHAGGGGGYYSELRLYPELRSGSFIIFNKTGFSDKRYLDKLDIHLINTN